MRPERSARVGGAGADSLDGGTGSDVFLFTAASDSTASARDSIVGFTRGQDRIDLSLIDANTGTTGNDAFAFIGTGAFSGVAGQLRYSTTSAGTLIQADTNGDRVADFELMIKSNYQPIAADFLL